MNFEIIYWYWLVLGIALAALELITVSFTILWFGLGAIIVGIVLYFLPNLELVWQLIIWGVASSLFVWFWFSYLKPSMKDKTSAGVSREFVIGQVGMVVQAPHEEARGQLRFTVPVLGAEEWSFLCDESLQAGDKVQVTDILGNALVVKKFQSIKPQST